MLRSQNTHALLVWLFRNVAGSRSPHTWATATLVNRTGRGAGWRHGQQGAILCVFCAACPELGPASPHQRLAVSRGTAWGRTSCSSGLVLMVGCPSPFFCWLWSYPHSSQQEYCNVPLGVDQKLTPSTQIIFIKWMKWVIKVQGEKHLTLWGASLNLTSTFRKLWKFRKLWLYLHLVFHHSWQSLY